MTAALWVAYAALVVAAVAGMAVAPWLRRDRVLRSKERRRYLVFLDGGETVDGLLVAWDTQTFVLADVHARNQAVPVAAAPGELYIPRGRVSYLQRVAGEQPAPVLVPVRDEQQAAS